MSDWQASSTHPEEPKKFKNNAKYRSNWSFVDPGNAVALFLWYDDLKTTGARIYQEFNLDDWVALFEANPKRHLRIKRARNFRDAVRQAYEHQLQIRVIIVEGAKEDISEPDAESSEVRLRHLDESPWHIGTFDKTTGHCVLIRGEDTTDHPLYADQFSLRDEGSTSPERQKTPGSAFKRSTRVRKSALNRAKGKCDFCGEYGFKMHDGRYYLETHHIVPLSEHGPDRSSNVAALCAVHHREAHFGERRDEITDHLRHVVQAFYE